MQLKSHWSCVFMSAYNGKWTRFHSATNQTATNWAYVAILFELQKLHADENRTFHSKKSIFQQIFVQQSFKSLFFLTTDKEVGRCRSSCQENQKADIPDTEEKTLLHTLSSVFGEGRLNLLRRAKYFPKNSSHRRDMWEAGFKQNDNLR